MFQSIYSKTIKNIQKSLGKDSGWIIDSVIDRSISISKYNPLAGSSYVKLPKKLDYPRKGLINIQNFDGNESFKWFIIRCLKPTDHNTGRITKDDRDFTKKLDFKDIKFLVKIRDIYKIEEKELYWH